MFLRHTKRKKDGKEHRYWSIVENRRIGGDRVVQRPLLYLGEIQPGRSQPIRRRLRTLGRPLRAPSNFFRRNVVLSFQEDAIGIRLRDVIGVDNMMWGSDRSRAVWEPPMLKRKRRASFSSDQLVPIVGDAAIATKSIGEGRIVPLIIFDENARPDLAELVRVHQELEPGDADCQWGS